MTRLTEALERWDDATGLERRRLTETIHEAARAVVEGVPILWCETHDEQAFMSEHEPGWVCPDGEWNEIRQVWSCSIVSRLLVDFPKEET